MAVTVAYLYPVIGGVAPTALQTADMVVATVIADNNADTDAVIVHNMGLSAAELAEGKPIVTLEPGIAEAAAARVSNWIVGAKAANQVTVHKAAGGGGAAGIQLRVVVRRPHSIGQ